MQQPSVQQKLTILEGNLKTKDNFHNKDNLPMMMTLKMKTTIVWYSKVLPFKNFHIKLWYFPLSRIFNGAARKAVPDSLSIYCLWFCEIISNRLIGLGTLSYNVVRLLLMLPIDFWHKSFLIFGLAARGMIEINNFRRQFWKGICSQKWRKPHSNPKYVFHKWRWSQK